MERTRLWPLVPSWGGTLIGASVGWLLSELLRRLESTGCKRVTAAAQPGMLFLMYGISEWLLPEICLCGCWSCGGTATHQHTADLDGLIQELAQLAITMLFCSWRLMCPGLNSARWGGVGELRSCPDVAGSADRRRHRPTGLPSIYAMCSWDGSLHAELSPPPWPLSIRLSRPASSVRPPPGSGVPDDLDDCRLARADGSTAGACSWLD